MLVEIRHDLDFSGEDYWEKAVLIPEYNQRLYAECLKFPRFELKEQREEGNLVHRRILIEPPLGGLPGPAKKVLGDKLSYVEEGTYDRKTLRYTFKVTPSTLSDKVKVEGEMWCEPRGEGKCTRHVRVNVDVKVFMVGSMIEDKIAADMRDSYTKAIPFTADWLKSRG
jgi:hypothetical protein